MDKLKKILFDWKVILLIIFLLLSIWTIQPRFSSSGAYVDTINKNSSAEISGIDTGHIITNINGQEIETLNAYANIVSELIGNVRKGEEYSKDEITKAILGATSNKSINESLIGNNARSLNAFKLDKVNIIKYVSEILFGFQYKKAIRENVYSAK